MNYLNGLSGDGAREGVPAVRRPVCAGLYYLYENTIRYISISIQPSDNLFNHIQRLMLMGIFCSYKGYIIDYTC